MIGDTIRQARQMHREVLEQTYDGSCAVYEKRSRKDPVTKVTRQEEILVFENLPCHLSFFASPSAAGSDGVTEISQTIKLLLAPEKIISPGSRIEVTQQGRCESYGQSGKAAVYASHQEVTLELWNGYA